MARLNEKRKAEWDQQMRDLICEATVSVLTEHGQDGLTMDRVAQTAKVAKGTLYNYFQDKTALLNEVQKGVFRDIRERIPQVAQSPLSPVENLREIATVCMESFQTQKPLVLVVFRNTSFNCRMNEVRTENRQVIRGIVADIVRDGMESGAFRTAPSAGAPCQPRSAAR